jgi:post-segregation antitoxin (ccd killing protein)
MTSITITTCIPRTLYDEAKKRGIKWSYAIRHGISALCKYEDGEHLKQVNTDLNDLKAENLKLNATMQRHISARVELQKTLDKIGGKA